MQPASQYDSAIGRPFFWNTVTDAKDDGASAVIGPEGGTVTVADPRSNLFGTSLMIPAGALDTPVRISISKGEHSCDFGLAPSIKLFPAGLQFRQSATLKICLDGQRDMAFDDVKTVEPAVYHYDESSGEWTHDSAARLERHGNTVLCDLHHL